MRHTLYLTALLALGLTVAAPSSAGDKAGAKKIGDGIGKGLKDFSGHVDEKFAMKAAMDGMAEVKLGKLAADNASSSDVKAFGAQMVKDHTKANEELKMIAKKEGIDLPMKMDEKHTELYEKLSAMKGADFDALYMKSQVMDHQAAVALFGNQAKNGKNESLRGFAAKSLPILEHHLEMAEKIARADGKSKGVRD